MDDNQFATSEQEDPHFAVEVDETPEVETEVDAPEAPAEVEKEAPKEPSKPKTLREELEAALSPKEEVVEAKPEAQAEAKPEEPAAPKLKAPQSWKAEARELFEGVPDAIKNEVFRREQEITHTLAKTADERKLAQSFLQAAQPYDQMYRARGLNPLQAAAELFNVDRVMSTGTAKEKAQVAAQMITQYGVDIDELSEFIVQAQSQAQQAPQVSPEYQQRLSQLEQHTYQQQQQFVQQQQNAVNNTIDQFASNPKNEFFNDVAQHMVGLLQAGTAKDLQEAYDQACYANPSVRKVLTQREQTNRQRAAAGTASLPPKGPRNGVKPIAKQTGSARDAITAAWDAAEGGRV